jgi:PAS domain-containing protein
MTELKDEINNMRQNIALLKKNIRNYAEYVNTLEVIWDSIPVIFFFKDDKNNLIRVNKHFCEVLNVTKEEVEGKNGSELTRDKSIAAKYATNDIAVLKTGKPKIGIEEMLFDTGIKLRTDKFPVIIDGKIRGVLGISVIINEN